MSRPVLNTPLSLQAQTRVNDGAGGYGVSWQELGKLWAEITPRGGGQRRGESGPISQSRVQIVTRAAPPDDPARPVAGQRMVGDSGVFLIRAVQPHQSSPMYLSCLAELEMQL